MIKNIFTGIILAVVFCMWLGVSLTLSVYIGRFAETILAAFGVVL